MRLTPIARASRASTPTPGRGRLKALAALSALSMMAVAGGVALFSDTDSTDPINVTTGAVAIELDGVAGSVSAPFGDIENFAPGETEAQRIDLIDSSTLPLGEITVGVEVDGPGAADLIAAGGDGFTFTVEVCDDPSADPAGDCEGALQATAIVGEDLGGALAWADDGDGIDISGALDTLDVDGNYQLTASIDFAEDADEALQALDVDLTFHAYAEQVS